jgi:hypothetical protein
MTDLSMADGFVIKPGEWQIAPASLFEFSPGQGLDEIMAEYQDKLFVVMQDYLYSSDPVTAYRNEFNRYINDAFTVAFVAGWADAGASALTDEAQSVLSGLISSEIQFADSLFTQLKTLLEDDEIPIDDKLDAAHAHAEGYTQTLVGVYAEGKMMGDPERDGKWELGATEQHCTTCADLNGKTHPLSWYLDNGYIPQEAGSGTLECGGWNCSCIIVDPKTGVQLIP